MSKPTVHNIQRITLRLGVNTKADADRLFANSRRIADQLLELLSPLFDEICPPDIILPIERLEVELADLDEPDFPQRLARAAAAAIQEQLLAIWQNSSPADQIDAAHRSNILQYYLAHGHLPWWAASATWVKGIGPSLLAVAAQPRYGELLAWLQDPAALRRAQRQSTTPELKRLNELLWEKAGAEAAGAAFAEFTALQNTFPFRGITPSGRVAEEEWLALLVRQQQQLPPHPADILVAFLRALARRLAKPEDTLIDHFSKHVARDPETARLFPLLADRRGTQDAFSGPDAAAALFYFLDRGALPAPLDNVRELGGWLHQALRRPDAELLTRLRTLFGREERIRRLLNHFPPAVVVRLVALLNDHSGLPAAAGDRAAEGYSTPEPTASAPADAESVLPPPEERSAAAEGAAPDEEDRSAATDAPVGSWEGVERFLRQRTSPDATEVAVLSEWLSEQLRSAVTPLPGELRRILREPDAIRRFIRAFPTELTSRVLRAGIAPPPANPTFTDEWAAIRYWLDQPTPERAEGQPAIASLARWITQQLELAAPEFAAKLRELWVDDRRRQRFLERFPPETVSLVRRKIAPDEPLSSPADLPDFVALLRGERPFTAAAVTAFVRAAAQRPESLRKQLLPVLTELLEREAVLAALPRPVVSALLALLFGPETWKRWRGLLADLTLLHEQPGHPLGPAAAQLPRARLLLLHMALTVEAEELRIAAFWSRWIAALASLTGLAPDAILAQYTALARPARTGELLHTALDELLPDVPTDESIPAAPDSPTATESAVLYLLEHGHFPKGRKLNAAEADRHFTELLAREPVSLRKQLVRLAQRVNLTDRLIDNLTASTVGRLLTLWWPDWAEEAPAYARLLADLRSIFPGLPRAGETYLLRTALAHVLASGDPVPDPVEGFTSVWFVRLAADSDLSYQDLLQAAERAADSAAPRSAKLLRSIQCLQRQLSPGDRQGVSTWLAAEQERTDLSVSVATLSLTTQRDAGLYWLLTGERAWWDNSGLSVDELLLRPSERQPERTLQAVRAQWSQPGLRRRLTGVLPVTLRRELLRISLQSATDFALAALLIGRKALERMGETRPAAWFWEELYELSWRTASFTSAEFTRNWIQRLAKGTAADPTVLAVNFLAEIPETEELYGAHLRRLLRDPDWISSLSAPTDSAEAPGRDRTEPEPESEPKELTLREEIQRDLALLRYFLQFGSLPVGDHRLSFRELEQRLDRLREEHPAVLREGLSDLIGSRKVSDRIVNTFAPATWRQLVFLWMGPRIAVAYTLRDELFALLAGFATRWDPLRMERSYHSQLFVNLGHYPAGSLPLAILANTVVDSFAVEERIALVKLWKVVRAELDQRPGEYRLLASLWPDLQAQWQRQARENQPEKNKTKTMDGQPDTPDDALYVTNAGLVLVAPFLGRFFSGLEMLDGKQFHEGEAERAVHLLQYIASGQNETPEHLLPFNKILCGLPVDASVPLSIELRPREEEMVDLLFRSVLHSWEMMKNSTQENLRGAFLLREGRLIETPSTWELKVQPESYDIVLDYLPWGISLLQLPWMEKRLTVTWRTTDG